MKLLFVTNHPNAPTGYGVQVRHLLPRLAALGHRVDVVAFYGQEGWIGEWQHPAFQDGPRHTVYPKMMHPYGQDAAVYWAQRGRYDVIITLIDAWVLDGAELSRAAHWAPLFPVDADPLPDKVLGQARWADTPLVYSQHGLMRAREAGLDPLYVPHAADATVYRPVDRAAARRHLDLPPDAFVFGYVMANKGVPPRKAWDRHLDALARVMRARPEVCAFFHTLVTPEMTGVPLVDWFHAYGIPMDRIRFADRLKFVSGEYTPHDVNLVYNGIDCLVNVSNGEGFGVPILEAQMAGTPVIAGGWTAMPEVTRSGWVIPRARANRVRLPVGGWQYEAHTDAIAEAMLDAVDRAPAFDREETRERVMEYDVDRVVAEHWRPALDVIQSRVNATPTVEVVP